ncbi:MAG: low specificity L-threonine aldolase [Alphaproteobacteria bacterium]|nr:low specificity L-threonine aldolase [Alphaproteobacteria bacterium]
MDFRSDNTAGASPEILAVLAEANRGRAAAYGDDELSRDLDRLFSDLFERPVRVFPVATGTAANALALAAIAPPYGAIYCHALSHIAEDECNAPEFFSGGAKLVAVDGANGRLEATAFERALALATPHGVHNAQPAAVSLSQSTELGTVYAVADIAAIAKVAHGRGLKIHMDGARLANALAALAVSPADMTWRAGIDILSFGATKNGALGAEAIVVFDPLLAERLPFLRKRAGQLFSKMRYVSAQFAAYLNDDLWLQNARHANAMAARLVEGLRRVGSIQIKYPAQANGVFPRLPPAVAAGLREDGFLFGPWGDPAEHTYRLVTSFDTRREDVERFVERAAGLAHR